MVQVPAHGEYRAIEGPPLSYVADTEVDAYARGQSPLRGAAVNALHLQRYGGTALNAPRERTWNNYVNDTNMECSNAQQQRFCLAKLPHGVPTNTKNKLDNRVEESKICG